MKPKLKDGAIKLSIVLLAQPYKEIFEVLSQTIKRDLQKNHLRVLKKFYVLQNIGNIKKKQSGFFSTFKKNCNYYNC